MTQEQRQKYQKLQIYIWALQQKIWPIKEISKQQAFAEIIVFAQILGLDFEPEDSRFLPTLSEKIFILLSEPDSQPAPSLPSKEILEADIEKEIKENQEKKLKIIYPTLNEQIKKIQKDYKEKISRQLVEEEPLLSQNPSLTEIISQDISSKIANNLPQVAQKQAFTKNEYQEIVEKIKPSIVEELKKVGIAQPKIETNENFSENFAGSTFDSSQPIAATPHNTFSVEKIMEIEKPSLVEEEIPLPDNIIEKLEQPPQEITFSPRAWIEKKFYTIPAKLLQIGSEEATPEWQAMINQGVFAEDFQASIKYLQKIGVPEKHPLLLKLSDKAARFQEQQKIEYKDKKGNVYSKGIPATSILKHYYHFNKATGRQKIYDSDLKTNLPQLSPSSDWSQGGYTGFLKKGLDRFRFVINTYEKFSKFVTKGQYTSFLTPARQFFSQKIGQPMVRWLAKTVAGKAAQQGAKKAATWIAAKLGMKLAVTAGVAAAGAATGPPGWIVAAVTIGLDILKTLGRKIIGFIRRIVQDPEKAFMAIGVGIIALVFIPMPFALIGIIPAVFGGLGLAGFALAPVSLAAAGAGFGAFFTALAAAPIVFPVALFLIILLSTLAVLTLFIVLVVSGSFILPTKVQEAAITTISPYYSEYFDFKKTADVIYIKNEDLPKEITYKISIKPKKGVLERPNLTEIIHISQEGSAPSITPQEFTDLPAEIGPLGWETEYKISVDERFKDSAIINSVKLSTFIIGIEEAKGTHEALASAAVIIGKPPGDCPPFPWPTTGKISQGPEGATSHFKNQEEAIDIANNIGTPVYAAHNGVAIAKEQTGGAGYYVEISGNCNGLKYNTEYFHLLERDRFSGNVTRGQLIGYMDDSGSSTGSHLHYEFRPKRPNEPFKMEPPNIPQALPFRKCDSKAECNIIIE